MSTDTDGAEETTLEYGVTQDDFRESPDVTKSERKRLRKHYGWIRTHFKTRPRRYRAVQRWLNQARIPTTYDVYLTRSVQYALLATLFGILLGAGAALALREFGVLATLTSPVRFAGGVGDFITRYRLYFAGGAIALASALTLGLGTWMSRYYYPRYLVSERARAIDLMLPHSITYMFALNRGGRNLVEVVEMMADATDTYDEVANEFDVIVRDMDVFGTDLMTAVRNARNTTPSDSMERFLDDLLAVLDSGGDTARFFEEQSDKYLKEAKERQEYFLETLSLLSELFIFAFIATPLFVIVTLMVISFVGGDTLLQMSILIYAGLPLGMAGFLLLIDRLSSPYVQPGSTLEVTEDAPTPGPDAAGDARFKNYRRTKRNKAIRSLLRNPLRSIQESPLLSMVVTVPVAAVVTGLLVIQGFVTPSVSAFLARPVPTTTLLVVVPLLVVTVPLSLFYERKRRRRDQITQRFPDTLNVLSSANSMGIRLTEALGLVSRYTTGFLAAEMRKVRNDVQWNYDLREALLRFGNRLKTPHLARTIKLVADGGRSSGDLGRILSIAAEDTRNRARMERDRRQAMGSYIAIVLIGFLVYLMVIVLIDTAYLARFAELAASEDPAARDLPISLTRIPIETYQALFFHSVLIQGFGAGLLAGKLSDNSLLSGLKYGIALVVLSVGVFLVL